MRKQVERSSDQSHSPEPIRVRVRVRVGRRFCESIAPHQGRDETLGSKVIALQIIVAKGQRESAFSDNLRAPHMSQSITTSESESQQAASQKRTKNSP